MKKVLIFGMTSGQGGVESFLFNYFSHIDKEKIQFDFLCYSEPVYADEIRASGGNIIIIPSRGRHYFKCCRAIKELLEKNKYDVVWSNLCYLSDVLVLKFAKRAGVKKRIIHSHNSVNMSNGINGFLHNRNKKIIEKIATDFWACAPAAGEYLFPKSVIDSGKLRIINNAVDAKKYIYNEVTRQETRDALGISDKLVIGHVGRFHFQKNHEFLIKVFSELQKKRHDCVLLLVGEGELMPAVKEQVEALSLSESVLFLGVRHDVDKLMQAMDIFLMPSLFEGLAVVIVEAQAAGLKCFASENTLPEEAGVTDLLEFISLSLPAEKWADRILQSADYMRGNTYDSVSKAGFDIFGQAEIIESEFLNV